MTFEKAMFATVFTMFVAGLWHGAAWTFVIFGILHGVGIAINHYWKKAPVNLPVWAAWLITFMFLNLSFVIFRAESMENALAMFKAMFGLNGIVLSPKYFAFLTSLESSGVTFAPVFSHIKGDSNTVALIVAAFVVTLAMKNSTEMMKNFESTRGALLFGVVLFTVAVSMLSRVSEFLYFNF